ncbi:hypothetical protein PR048_033040 [Dryococelus australis]|uniref:Uncharacterized protein n=1 Tax=Dryococelus australis TaxID=614101 RepID=A0ABQ9G6R9_9NEOP|nr:hypothetical protein PR048_033040 [Dryococelus australis]
MPYDLYCPSVRRDLEERCCSTYGIYFSSITRAAEHRRVVHRALTARARKVRPSRIVTRQATDLLCASDNGLEWLNRNEVEGADDFTENHMDMLVPVVTLETVPIARTPRCVPLYCHFQHVISGKTMPHFNADLGNKNPSTSGIDRHDSHLRISGATRPGRPWWEASRLTTQPPRACPARPALPGLPRLHFFAPSALPGPNCIARPGQRCLARPGPPCPAQHGLSWPSLLALLYPTFPALPACSVCLPALPCLPSPPCSACLLACPACLPACRPCPHLPVLPCPHLPVLPCLPYLPDLPALPALPCLANCMICLPCLPGLFFLPDCPAVPTLPCPPCLPTLPACHTLP